MHHIIFVLIDVALSTLLSRGSKSIHKLVVAMALEGSGGLSGWEGPSVGGALPVSKD